MNYLEINCCATSTECAGCANKAGFDWYVGNDFSEIYFGTDNASLGGSVRCVMD